MTSDLVIALRKAQSFFDLETLSKWQGAEKVCVSRDRADEQNQKQFDSSNGKRKGREDGG